MIQLTSWPAIIVEYGLAVFCFLDVVLMRETQVRWMPRAVWALLLLCFPVAGSVGWIAAGRPWRHHKPIPDDVEPDEPTRPGDPFHQEPQADTSSPGPQDPRRPRGRPSRRHRHDNRNPHDNDDGRDPRTEPGGPDAGPADHTDGGPHHDGGPAHDDRRDLDRWRWHSRPRRRPGRFTGAPDETSPPHPADPAPDDEGTGRAPSGRRTPPGGRTPPSGPAAPGGPTPPIGIPLPRPDMSTGGERQALESGLISELFAVHEEHERTLRRWEEELRRREEDLRRREEDLRRQAGLLGTPPGDNTPPADPPAATDRPEPDRPGTD